MTSDPASWWRRTIDSHSASGALANHADGADRIERGSLWDEMTAAARVRFFSRAPATLDFAEALIYSDEDAG